MILIMVRSFQQIQRTIRQPSRHCIAAHQQLRAFVRARACMHTVLRLSKCKCLHREICRGAIRLDICGILRGGQVEIARFAQ